MVLGALCLSPAATSGCLKAECQLCSWSGSSHRLPLLSCPADLCTFGVVHTPLARKVHYTLYFQAQIQRLTLFGCSHVFACHHVCTAEAWTQWLRVPDASCRQPSAVAGVGSYVAVSSLPLLASGGCNRAWSLPASPVCCFCSSGFPA